MYYKAKKQMLSNPEFSDSEKLLVILIEGLSQKEGYCFATNQKLSDMLSWEIRKLNRVLASILDKGVVTKDFINNNGRSLRKLTPNDKNDTLYNKYHGGGDKFVIEGGDKNDMSGMTKMTPILEEDNKLKVLDKKSKRDVFFPFDGNEFLEMWKQWKEYKAKEHNFKYKSVQSEQAALNKLSNMSGGVESTAVKIILQSLENGWKGFFGLKNEKTVNNGIGEISEEWLNAR